MLKLFKILSINLTIFLLVFTPAYTFFSCTGLSEGDAYQYVIDTLQFGIVPFGKMYRFYWQPASTLVFTSLMKITGNPNFITAFCTACMSLAVVTLISMCRKNSGSWKGAFICFVGILCVPEIIYTGLYINSSAPAMLFSVMALHISLPLKNKPSKNRLFISGVLCGLSAIFRFEFIITVFIIMRLSLSTFNKREIASRFIIMAGSSIPLGVFWSAGFISFSHLFSLAQEQMQSALYGTSGFPLEKSDLLMNAYTLVNPIAVIYLLFCVLIHCRSLIKQRKIGILLVGSLFFLSFLMVILVLTTPKYAVPWIIFIPYLMVRTKLLTLTKKKFTIFISLSVIFLLCASTSPFKPGIFLLQNVLHPTHEGARSSGAVAAVLKWYADIKTKPTSLPPWFGKSIADLINSKSWSGNLTIQIVEDQNVWPSQHYSRLGVKSAATHLMTNKFRCKIRNGTSRIECSCLGKSVTLISNKLSPEIGTFQNRERTISIGPVKSYKYTESKSYLKNLERQMEALLS